MNSHVRFAQSARKHRVGRASALFIIENNAPAITSTVRGDWYWWEGVDERGRELEIGAVIGEREGTLLIIHVMPIAFRNKGGSP